jgi:tetraacyldisaccharide 4'-kinase
MKLARILLFPFAVLYDVITRVRNRLYDLELKPSVSFDLVVIGVGNLSVGGTGKTPMVEYLVRLLQPQQPLATLSRGYGRTTRGIRIANLQDNATTIGDEPYQVYKRFKDKIVVAVGEERALAIPYLLDEHPETRVVLLDDAFQHRRVKPSFQVLLTDFNAPFYTDYLLPAGRLRESRDGARRADIIVVTKCPDDLTGQQRLLMEAEIRAYSDKPVFFSTIRYGAPVPIGNDVHFNPTSVVLVSGIANPGPLENYAQRNFTVKKHMVFSDHHHYRASDMEAVLQEARKHQACVLITEKDAAKIAPDHFGVFLSEAPFFYLPMEMEFLKNGKEFDQRILNAIANA